MAVEHVKIKEPKRVIHCCDGDLPEYSSDEEAVDPPPKIHHENPKDLAWPAWLSHKARSLGESVIRVADRAGGKLAGWSGLTDNKFDVELREHDLLEKQRGDKEKSTFIIDPASSNKDEGVPLHLSHESAQKHTWKFKNSPDE